MRNWIKQIRDPDREVHVRDGRTVMPLRNGRAVDCAELHALPDLCECRPTAGEFPPESIVPALTDDALFLADTLRGETYVFKLI